METALIILTQVLIMFLLAGIGFIMFRTGKLSLEGSKSLGNILIYLSLPCVIIKGFQAEYSSLMIQKLLYSSLAAAIILGLCILISRLFFRKDPIAGFAAAFSNPGFFGIPLITASLGNEAVFFIASFIAFLNLLQWTYGVSILTGKKVSFSPKTLLKAPFFIAICIGLFLFLTGLKVPSILQKSVDFLAGLNTPLAMFTVGVYLAQTNLRKMFTRPKLYAISGVRLLLIPLVALAGLILLPADMSDMRLALLIAAACPVGSNIAVYAQLHDKDYPYAVETVVISTMLSVVTLPLLVALTGIL